jgi:hypothetical protein
LLLQQLRAFCFRFGELDLFNSQFPYFCPNPAQHGAMGDTEINLLFVGVLVVLSLGAAATFWFLLR